MSGLEWLFACSAVIGAILLVSRTVLMLIGLDHGGADANGDVDTDAGGVDADHDMTGGHDGISTEAAFRLLTMHGVMAASLMFGLVGLALFRESQAGAIASLLGATAAGALAMYLVGKLFASVMKLQCSGTISLTNAIGQEGRVYLTVGKDKEGKVEVPVQGRLMVLDAISVCDEDLPTGTMVEVERLVGETVLGVVKLDRA